jgi:integrase
MVLAMPSPVLVGNTFYLRVRVPADVPSSKDGIAITLPVGSKLRRITMKDFVKVSLETREPRIAKERFSTAYAALQTVWKTLKDGPKPLTHKQSLAIAGEIRAAFIEAFDDDPGSVHRWQRVLTANTSARAGKLNGLTIPTLTQQAKDMERRFGELADARLAAHGILLAPQHRQRLLTQVADGLDEMATVNLAKAGGDYSDNGASRKYPAFEQPRSSASVGAQPSTLSFSDVIDERVRRLSAGKDAAPPRDRTIDKYRLACEEFAAHRKSTDLATVTAIEADRWKLAMMEAGALSNNTIGQRLQNVRTVIEWARKNSLGELFSNGNPLEVVERPSFQPKPSDLSTYTLAEAKMVLAAARKETASDLRWLPWVCAYSGARIEEVAQLTKADFSKVGDDWFYRLTSMGGKTLKNRGSERRVPVHPVLIDEGFIEFINELNIKDDKRIFTTRPTQRISEWIREVVGITREELRPNHGWRHLFEDLCMLGGVLDAARLYITGRMTGRSDAGYGKSDVMLPGLATEMKKVSKII